MFLCFAFFLPSWGGGSLLCPASWFIRRIAVRADIDVLQMGAGLFCLDRYVYLWMGLGSLESVCWIYTYKYGR